ncbi:MAG: hypothetical protein HUJ42_00955 [Malacoplasma sp.]|nr:hypothetical protein [Malacoplasma sp.]
MKKKKIILAITSLPLLTSIFGIPLSISESKNFSESTSINKDKSTLNAYDYSQPATPAPFKKETNFEAGVPKSLDELNKLSDTDIQKAIKAKKYDSRNYDIVTPGVSQGNSFLCWAYGTKAVIETSLLKNKVYTGDVDKLNLSATNITYTTKIRDGDVADKLGLSAPDSFTGTYNSGGQLWESMSMLTQWTSPENIGQDDFAYWDYQTPEYAKDLAGVPKQIINLSNATNDEIKAAIVKYGSVTVVVDVGFSKGVYAEYINGTKQSNYKHAVTLIGWDDSIKKSSYMDGSSVDGGWIAKNSGQGGWYKLENNSDDYWDNFDDIGTLRISMDSKFTQAYAVDYTSYNKNENQYYYDGVADQNNSTRLESKMGAIFPALNEAYNKKEVLKKVFFGVASGNNFKANVEVYKKNSLMTNPEDGTLVGKFTTDAFKYPGYYYVDVPKEMQQELKAGEFFSVVVELTNGAKLMTSLESSTNDYTMYWNASKKQWVNLFDRQSAYGSNYVARIRAVTETEDKATADTAGQNNVKYAKVTIPGEYLTMATPYSYKSNYKKPEPTVVLNGVTLVKDKDYTVEYKQVLNPIDASRIDNDNYVVGSESITIKGIGKYSGVNNKCTYNIKIGLIPPGLDAIGTWDKDPNVNKGNPTYSNPVVVKIKSSVKKYGQINIPQNWIWLKQADADIELNTVMDSPLVYKGSDINYFRRSGTYVKFVIDEKDGLSPNQAVVSSQDLKPAEIIATNTNTGSESEVDSPVETTDSTPSQNTSSVTPTEDTKPAETTPETVDTKPEGTNAVDNKPADSTPVTETTSANKEAKTQELNQIVSTISSNSIKVNDSIDSINAQLDLGKQIKNINVSFVLPENTQNVEVAVSDISKDSEGNIVLTIKFTLKDNDNANNNVSELKTYKLNSQNFSQSTTVTNPNTQSNTVAIAAGVSAGVVAILIAAAVAGIVIYKKKHLKK